MKKWCLTVIAILSCSVSHAGEPEKVEQLSLKVILQNTNGYFVLTDGSCWKAVPFVKRWRTPSEWWGSVELVPQNYECVPNDWYLGAQIEVYPKYGNLTINEANASNQEVLKQCTHLMVNSRTGQVIFAIALHQAECLVQLFNEAKSEGFDEGYSKGRSQSYANSTEVYNAGRSEGYRVGYAEGYQAAAEGQPPAN